MTDEDERKIMKLLRERTKLQRAAHILIDEISRIENEIKDLSGADGKQQAYVSKIS